VHIGLQASYVLGVNGGSVSVTFLGSDHRTSFAYLVELFVIDPDSCQFAISAVVQYFEDQDGELGEIWVTDKKVVKMGVSQNWFCGESKESHGNRPTIRPKNMRCL
jgi:hypothetical protein